MGALRPSKGRAIEDQLRFSNRVLYLIGSALVATVLDAHAVDRDDPPEARLTCDHALFINGSIGQPGVAFANPARITGAALRKTVEPYLSTACAAICSVFGRTR